MADKESPATAPKNATGSLPARAQAIADWHAAATDAERIAAVKKWKDVPEADLRTIYAPAGSLKLD